MRIDAFDGNPHAGHAPARKRDAEEEAAHDNAMQGIASVCSALSLTLDPSGAAFVGVWPHWKLEPDLLHHYASGRTAYPEEWDAWMCRHMNGAEVGCAATHLYAWTVGADTNADYFLVSAWWLS